MIPFAPACALARGRRRGEVRAAPSRPPGGSPTNGPGTRRPSSGPSVCVSPPTVIVPVAQPPWW